MSFNLRNLSVLAYANGFTLWHYKTSADTYDQIFQPRYFAAGDDLLTHHDMVMISGSDRGGAGLILKKGSPIILAPLLGDRPKALESAEYVA